MAAKKVKRGPGPKRAATAARCLVRRGMALELRKKGTSFRQIAALLRGQPGVPPGYCEANAYRDVQAELEAIAANNTEAAEAVRNMEIIRLDRLLSALDAGIESGDPNAINTAIRIGESRRKLMGLDAPSKSEVTGANGAALGGVLLCPAPMDSAQWEATVAAQQAALVGKRD